MRYFYIYLINNILIIIIIYKNIDTYIAKSDKNLP